MKFSYFLFSVILVVFCILLDMLSYPYLSMSMVICFTVFVLMGKKDIIYIFFTAQFIEDIILVRYIGLFLLATFIAYYLTEFIDINYFLRRSKVLQLILFTSFYVLIINIFYMIMSSVDLFDPHTLFSLLLNLSVHLVAVISFMMLFNFIYYKLTTRARYK